MRERGLVGQGKKERGRPRLRVAAPFVAAVLRSQILI